MSKSLPAFTQDNQYPFSYLRMGQLGYNSPGVVLAGDMQVSPGTGLQVQISAGEAYVQQTVARLGSFYAQRGVYQIFDDSVDNPYNTITAPVTYPRVDQVIARVYDSYEQSLSGSSYWRYEWLPGTETSGASLTNLNGAAALPDNSLRLAYCLATVSMSSWSSGNILNVAPAIGAPLILTSSGLVFPPSSTGHMKVTLVGGGGGGGSGFTSASGTTSPASGGGGGGAGQYVTALQSLSGVASLTATIGSGGAASTGGSNTKLVAKNSGGTTLWTLTAVGGGAGTGTNAGLYAQSGSAASSLYGTVGIGGNPGYQGGSGVGPGSAGGGGGGSAVSGTVNPEGAGGNSGGGDGGAAAISANGTAGSNATTYGGGGGGGGGSASSGPGYHGGAGGTGYQGVIIAEWLP